MFLAQGVQRLPDLPPGLAALKLLQEASLAVGQDVRVSGPSGSPRTTGASSGTVRQRSWRFTLS